VESGSLVFILTAVDNLGSNSDAKQAKRLPSNINCAAPEIQSPSIPRPPGQSLNFGVVNSIPYSVISYRADHATPSGSVPIGMVFRIFREATSMKVNSFAIAFVM
jgi:hypothetical protein